MLITLAKDASEFEHQLSPLEAMKAYPMAIFWSLMVSMCVVMEGSCISTFHITLNLTDKLTQDTIQFSLGTSTHIRRLPRNTDHTISLSTVAPVDTSCQHHGKLALATLQESVPSLVSLRMDGSSIDSVRNSQFWSPSWFSRPSYSLRSLRRMLESSQQVKCYVVCLGECSPLLHRHMHLKFFHSRCECISLLIRTCRFF